MLFKAHVEGGKVVLDDPVAIADGTQLLVQVLPSAEQIKRSRERLMKYAGVDRSPETNASTTFEKELYDSNE